MISVEWQIKAVSDQISQVASSVHYKCILLVSDTDCDAMRN